MELKCFPLMVKESKRAMMRTKWRWGRSYNYIPNRNLVKRLSQQLQMSENKVREQIASEREFIIKNKAYYHYK